MYDTVVASIEWPEPLDESVFTGGQSTSDLQGSETLRLWRNEPHQPRLTYWRRVGQMGGRLRVEFSIPKMANISPYDNPTESDKARAIDRVQNYLGQQLSYRFPQLSQWNVSRVDYAWNWDVGKHLSVYMSMLQQLSIGGMARHPYPDAQGVIFKSKQRGSRWIKFYDKGKEQGDLSCNVLRFEVSNYKRTIPYMCESWFGCDRTVGEVLRPGRALYCMAVMWQRLGLANAATYGGDSPSLMIRMRKDFGNAALAAYGALSAIHTYGDGAFKEYGLMSSNTYYRWKRALTEHEYMTEHSSTSLMALHLPTDTVYQYANIFTNAQNLGIGGAAGEKTTQKIFAQILAPALGVRPEAKPSEYLVRRLTNAIAA
jgi:hypothetical protein